MKEKLTEEQMLGAIHRMLQDDKEYKKDFIRDMTEEEYEAFITECPEFLEDM